MKCGLFVFLICVAMVVSTVLVQPGVQISWQDGLQVRFETPDVHAAGSNVTNDLIGNLVVFSQDYTDTSIVPSNICLALETMPGYTENATLGYNGTSRCVSLDVTEGASGRLFVGGLSPSLSTTITLDMGMGRTEDHATVNVFAGGAQLAIRLRNGTPTDALVITSYYYNPTLLSATSVTEDVGFSDSGRFKITIVSNSVSKTNTIYLNDVEKLTTPFTAYRAHEPVTVYDPFVVPFIYFAFDSIYSGQIAYLQLYSIEQTVPEYSYITPISNPELTSFGVDGPHAWDTVDTGLSLLDHGTIWADLTYVNDYSPSELAALKALIADGWELGIHFSSRLSDLPLADAITLMNAQTASITAIFGEPPTSFCSLQGADNTTHAEYAYTNLGMVSRNAGSILTNVSNLGDNCWNFWNSISAAGIVIPSFSHELDITPAITYSISPGNFSSFLSNYASNGVHIVGFREYWEIVQNSYHTAISNIVSDPGVSLSFTVANMGGKSRLLVNAPWANVVRDSSGGNVPYEVSGSGIVIEVEGGNYTVAAAPQADFSADKTAVVEGQAIQFTNLSIGGLIPLSYEWDFGDGMGSTLQNPSHSYSSAGTFTLVLQVTDSATNTDTETKAKYITVTTSPPTNNPPNTPVNSSPGNETSGVSLTPTLQSSAFSDPDVGDTHTASQWQITAVSDNYTSTVFDSGTDNTDLTSITVPSLSYSTTYYWHVRYRDNRGDWSSWSAETSFTTSAVRVTAPLVVTSDASNVATTSATLNGNLTSLGTAENVTVSFVWGTTSGSYPNETTGQDMTSTGIFYFDLGSLLPGNTYYYKTKAVGPGGTVYGAEKSFTTGQKNPVVEIVDPGSGKRKQHVTVTISGSNLDGATIVDFGSGITVEDFSVNSSTEITAEITVDADATKGARNVSVTTGWGTATKTDGFSVVGGRGGVCSGGATATPGVPSEMTTTLFALGLLLGVGYLLVRRSARNGARA
jgi:PKD repeat protein